MFKFIVALCVPLYLFAHSPIVGYDRVVDENNLVEYVQKEGKFRFVPKKLVDSDNIYNKGKKDTYDDPYIEKVLMGYKVDKFVKGGEKSISIVFRDKEDEEKFVKSFDMEMFQREHLSLKIYYLKGKRQSKLPLNLSVYPFFVMSERFSQGYLTQALLKELIIDSDYEKRDKKISTPTLEKRVLEKYKMTKNDMNIVYNTKIELFEMRIAHKSKIYAYVSKDGRYILMM